MAPRKRKTEEDVANEAETRSTRVTRSSTRLANGNVPSAPLESTKGRKKVKTSDVLEKGGSSVAENAKAETEVEAAPTDEVDGGSRNIVIEHCKQCNSFKTRAVQVKEGLEQGVAGVSVLLNPEKPRRGCFEIREEGGEKFISLLDMKRPFKPMKALEMDKVISDIIDKIK